MAEINLNDKFPDLQPVDKPPSLWTVNGVGLSILGARDKDAETQTYIKTHAFTFLFVPIFALAAYRVAKANGNSWYFIGREPLSALAKAWNVAIAFVLVGGVSYAIWNAKYNTPEAIADRKIAEAEALVANGKIVGAARAYQSVANGTSKRADAARNSLVSMHDLPQVKSAPLTEVAEVFQLELATRRASAGDAIGQSVLSASMDLVESRYEDDLVAANELCRIVHPIAIDSDETVSQRFNAIREAILEKLIAAYPDKTQYASDLAESLEAKGDLKRCEELLKPHAQRLGATEGARILGQIWASQGKVEEAFSVLDPYCETRLSQLNAAEDALESTYEQEQQRIVEGLNRGAAPQSFYSRYDRADETQQQAMVQEYLDKKLEGNPAIERARLSYIRQTSIVPVALDLGMVRLRRAQAMTDVEKQRAELEAAETTFKSIRSVAGDSDEYRLYMGQVNYWLGKYEEGRWLFETLLDANGREHSILLAVANMVREVGRSAEARKLVEEAYDKATDPKQKHEAAMRRASMLTDNEDQLKWLERSDLTEPTVNASYQSARATAAFIDGDFETAKSSYRESIAAYDKTPETVATLNNSGLTCFSLYRVTGDQADFDEGLRRIEKAMSLQPADSILRINASHILLAAAYSDLVGDQIDVAKLKSEVSIGMLGVLYDNDAEKKQVVQRFRDHKGAKRAIELLDKVALLAPKNAGTYQSLLSIHQFRRDLPELKKLLGRVVKADPEVDTQLTLDYYAGKNSEKHLKSIKGAIERTEQALSDNEPQSPTHALLVSNLADHHQQLAALAPAKDLDRLITLAESAYAAAPSSHSRWTLLNLLATRAHFRLAESHDAYQQLAESTRRTLSCPTVLALATFQSQDLRKAVHEDRDVAELMKLVRISTEAFPMTPGSWEWAMLRHSDAAAAAQVAEKIKTNERAAIVRKINMILSPVNLEAAIQGAWMDVAMGDLEGAREVMKRIEKAGVSVPFEIGE
jgi:tetratricopeptide (TPR) repeat protein